ncbi:alpha/beta hydrolase family protein [Kineococcus indalonis]|uniref:alpha/beta hydrolase family protein n=1 Tax=Kineococcus indalonis TaxID=2696566 RepID=UPI00196A54D1|nr:alpha/beta hydrolase [Kineococcus indalonis]NAZ88108.1 alpha/beta hydrolase [Kineococcus indalonis]
MTDTPPTTDTAPTTEDRITTTLQAIAEGFRTWPRSPILHRPDEVGLDYEDVSFPSEDGTPLEGWFIPARGSDKIIIANHPRWFNRSGLPSHLEPWKSFGGATGNDIEVDFVPDYQILHDAGYNVLAYDLRNFGHSGQANGGIFTVGRFESRDVIGSLDYVRSRDDTKDMAIGLFSRCVGANSTMFAMTRRPDAFDGVRCMVAPQPLSSGVALERALERLGIPGHRIDDLEERIRLITSFRLEEFSPVPWAKNVTVPTLLYQVRDDLYTRPDDVQSVYDNIPTAEKELFWIEGITRRWDGYTHFQRHPARVLDWFDRYVR